MSEIHGRQSEQQGDDGEEDRESQIHGCCDYSFSNGDPETKNAYLSRGYGEQQFGRRQLPDDLDQRGNLEGLGQDMWG